MKIAIVGATGLVGESLIGLLDKKMIDATYYLFASKASQGKRYDICGRTYVVDCIENCFDCAVDVAFLMCSADLSRQYAPVFLANGATVIDNSSYFRLRDEVPLVIDSINGQVAKGKNLIANPNCTTIGVAMVLDALKELQPKSVVVSTYQAVSGAGRDGVCELNYKSNYGNLKQFAHPIYDNVIPAIDCFCSNGYTGEEMKMHNECQKLFGEQIKVSCTAVRVPVSVGHCASLTINFAKKFDLAEVIQRFSAYPNLIVCDNASRQRYPMPIIAKNTPFVYVGRIRRDIALDNTLSCFVALDNLVRGASFNAYEIFRRVCNV
ncbi:MAG: aspartate-semialdehyde dehydrogenase [Clostridia bacterium]|nr:aspartate-semialdehyde dehydrogenase [Clostridia bacterium]